MMPFVTTSVERLTVPAAHETPAAVDVLYAGAVTAPAVVKGELICTVEATSSSCLRALFASLADVIEEPPARLTGPRISRLVSAAACIRVVLPYPSIN